MTVQRSMVPNPVELGAVEKAVAALVRWRTKNVKWQAHQGEFLLMILTLKKIPTRQQTKLITLPIPHPLFSATGTLNLCLIYDDRRNSNLNSMIVNRRIEEENISVTKVLKLSKLKADFQSLEAKRKLCDSYEMFIADQRIVDLARTILGKHFLKKKKVPIEIDLEADNWNEQVQKVCGSAVLNLRTGTCNVVKVGTLLMEKYQLVENTMAAITAAGEAVPRKWGNVRSVHLKLSESIALPVYESLSDSNTHEGEEEQSRCNKKRHISDIGSKSGSDDRISARNSNRKRSMQAIAGQ